MRTSTFMGVCMKQVILTSVFMVATSFGTSATELTKEKGTELCPVATYASGGICLMEEGGSTYVYTKDIEPIIVPEPVVPPREPKLTDEQKFKVLAVAYIANNNGDTGTDPIEEPIVVNPLPPEDIIIEPIDVVITPIDPGFGVDPIEVMPGEPVDEPIKVNPIKDEHDLDMSWKSPLKILDPRDQAGWNKLYALAQNDETRSSIQTMMQYMERWATCKDCTETTPEEFDKAVKDLFTNIDALQPVQKVLAMAAINNINVNHTDYVSLLDQLVNGFGKGTPEQKTMYNKFQSLRYSKGIRDAARNNADGSRSDIRQERRTKNGWTREKAKAAYASR